MEELKHRYSLFKLTVKDSPMYDCYIRFLVVAETVPEALEYMYNYVCRHETQEDGITKYTYDDIPFYLRSSNIKIDNLGEFIPKEKLWKNDDHILCTDTLGD